MVSFSAQLKLLIWKNWILRKRHKTRVFMEFVWPLILFLILMWVRTRGLKQKRPSCHLVEKSLPSVGGFEFVQNFFCTLNNTCHKDYVENQGNLVWENSMFMKLISDTSPLLEDIVSSPKGISTVGAVWNDAMGLMQVVGGFFSKSDTSKLGTVKFKELMGMYGRKAFVEVVSTYTSLTPSDAKKLLESDIFLDHVDSSSIEELLTYFNSKNCTDNRTDFTIVKFIDAQLVHDICLVDSQEKLLITFFSFRYVNNNNGLVKKLRKTYELNNFIEQDDKLSKLMEYDIGTLTTIIKLNGVMSNFGKHFSRFSHFNGTDLITALAYEGLCGVEIKGNRSSFGFDPGSANRFDSLRDRLKEWNPDHHYEVDPDISPICNSLFQRLESIPFTALLWRQVKPFIRGVIYYAPITPFTETVMSKVDERFNQLRDMEVGINSLIRVLHRSRKWLRANYEELRQTMLAVSDEKNLDVMLNFFGFIPQDSTKTQIVDVLKQIASADIEVTLEKLDFVAELLSETISCIKYNKTAGFDTEWEAVNEGSKLLSAEKLWAVVIFENVQDSDGNGTNIQHLKYKIRMDSDKVDGTRLARDRLTSKTPRRRPAFDLKYITNGFAYLQEMIEHSVIEVLTAENLPIFSTYLQQFPYPCHIYDQFIRAISRTFPLFMVLSWVYASSMIVKSVVMEKELRLREVMKVMGLGNGVIWCGWFIDSFGVMSISATILTVILKYGKIIENSDVTLIWVFMISYTVATISFSFLVSTFFARANSAAAAGGILFFVSYLPYNMLLVWEETLSWYHIMSSCLMSNVAFGFGCTYFARYEEDGVGGQWDRITLSTLPGDDFNLSYCILMLWFDSVLYCGLTWYIEALFPGASGVPKPWNFFLKRTYWKGRTKPRTPTKVLYQTVPEAGGADYVQPIIEQEPEGLVAGVTVTNLSKTYSNGKVALDDLSINFYENQITSFLGHNGAGKTTTISILTGLFPATSGTARIYGLDIHKDMDSIRHGTGICPQYNTLFDRLNVEEHMQFYAGLKGKYNASFEAEFTQMISDLGIPHKRYEFPKNLSGGMKRKLSVACSFIGGSKTVFLDEPTSGVDPYSRRSIWELLIKYKQGRTIILTTHFMDEADILGDRIVSKTNLCTVTPMYIAIISQGKLKACGSSLFLKSHFGQGYSLRLVRDDPLQFTAPKAHGSSSPIPGFHMIEDNSGGERKTASRLKALKQTETMVNFIKQNVQDVILVDDIGSEVVFLLPYRSIQGFPILFQRLDEHKQDLGISTYGISDTTLEDVFLKITIQDIEGSPEQFQALDGKCKRRVMEMLRKIRVQMKRKKQVPVVVAPENRVEPGSNMERTLPPPIVTTDPNVIEASCTRSNGSIAPCIITRSMGKVDVDGNLVPGSIMETGSNSASSSLLEELALEDEFPARSSDKNYSSCCLALIQIRTIFLKRLWNSNRNRKAMFFEIILPAVFIAITLAFTLILPPATDEPPRVLTPWTYPSPNLIFFSDKHNDAKTVPQFSSFINGLLGPVGMGTACVKDQLPKKLCDPKQWSNSTVSKFQETRRKYVGHDFDICTCESGSMQCPDSVNSDALPRIKIPTNDKLYDTSKINIPEWIEKTYRNFETSRYGGFEMQRREKLASSVTGFLDLVDQITELRPGPGNLTSSDEDDFFGSTIKAKPVISVYKVWYENRGWVSSVAYLNAMHNVILRQHLPDHLNKDEFGITVTSHPMNLTKSQSTKESLKTAGLGVIHAVCIIFALSFVPASFTVYLIEERKSGAKHLHLVSGVKPITYWISNLLYDLTKYLVPVVLCLMLFWAFDAKAYIGSPSVGSFVCLLLLYGWASIPAMYPFSFWFSVPSTAFVVLACMNLFIGVMTTVSTFVLEQFGDEELERIGGILKQVQVTEKSYEKEIQFLVFCHHGFVVCYRFLIFPHYCLGRGLIELVRLDVEAIALNKLGLSPSTPKDRFEWDHLGKMLCFLSVHGFVFFFFNICFEYRQLCYFLFKKTRPPMITGENEDEDVLKERNRVMEQPNLECTLRAENLTKYYSRKKHPAVNGLTFAIEKGECFGLLGVNGAGKSSSFKMLTGDVRITSGRAKICEADVETNLDGARRHFGYCPQEDGLDPLLDAYELLRIYGLLRGMTPSETNIAVHKLVQTLGLTACGKRRCGTFSGGNKRKLSTAIALIGDPDVVFLDEPTSGMDPVSRRKFWKVILRLVRIGKSVVLTSHSMEECEALCSRIAIMVNGQFMCLGGLQHLKNRFGDGYTMTVRCPKDKQEDLLLKLEESLSSARHSDSHCSQMKFVIPQLHSKLSDIFNVMYSMKEKGFIEDYSVSQTTLDDIFVKFASNQKDDMDR